MEDQITLETFLQRYRIRISKCTPVDANPHMAGDTPADRKWNAEASHWRVTLLFEKRRMIVYFSQGSAHTSEPTTQDIVSCVASDSACIENGTTFEQFCTDLGYDVDSRRAEKTFKACKRTAVSLRRLCGSDDIYQTLLFGTEAL